MPDPFLRPILVMAPLDERPVNTRYPQMLAAIAGLDLRLPPGSIIGHGRSPADALMLAEWLEQTSGQGASAGFVCAEMLCYGNLINARISTINETSAISRLTLLETLGKSMPVHAFSVITRVANANDCVEEPSYWKEWGTRCHRYSTLAHLALIGQVKLGSKEAREFRKLDREIPAPYRRDWLQRRLRNHTVNLVLLGMAARGAIASLRLTSDDTAEYGLPSRERDWLASWPDLLGDNMDARVRMHPGADEVGSVLIAWWLNGHRRLAPKVWIDYTIEEDSGLIAPYEDRPISETVMGQIVSSGCTTAATARESDFVLAVVTPSPRLTDYSPEFTNADRWDRSEAYVKQVSRMAKWQKAGKPVAIADVAYPNGSDPLFTEIMLDPEHGLTPGALAAYGAWNTAGNTLGVVCAQASCALAVDSDPERVAAQRLFLAHRFLEDDGYQSSVRRAVREEGRKKWGHQDPEGPEESSWICERIAVKLGTRLTSLQSHGIGEGLTIKPGTVRLPWDRTFEVDFELTQG